MTGAYALMNKVTGEWYGGQSIDIDRRIRQHLAKLRRGRSDCRKLQAAYDKHGEAAFVGVVLEVCERGQLDAVEQKYLDGGFAADVLYNNATRAGWPPAGHAWSEDSRANRAEAQRERLADPEGRARYRAGMAKRPASWREQLVARGRAWRSNATAVERHDLAMAARSEDPAWQQMMRERNARLAADPDWKAKVSAAHSTPAAKKNHGAATKRFWDRIKADPAAYEAMKEKIRAGRRAL